MTITETLRRISSREDLSRFLLKMAEKESKNIENFVLITKNDKVLSAYNRLIKHKGAKDGVVGK